MFFLVRPVRRLKVHLSNEPAGASVTLIADGKGQLPIDGEAREVFNDQMMTIRMIQLFLSNPMDLSSGKPLSDRNEHRKHGQAWT